MKSGVFMKRDRLAQTVAAIKTLPKIDVLVGIPAEDTERQAGDPMTNATLGYIHENGAPSANIPARPWLAPGIKRAEDQVADYFLQAGRAGLDGDVSKMRRGLELAGMAAATAAQMTIRDGIPPPLAQATVNARRRRSKGSTYRRNAASAAQTTPLIDTTQMLRSIKYVLRDKRS